MNERIEQAKEVVRRAKADYINRLKQAEGLLKVVVAQDPTDVEYAIAVQESYGDLAFAKALLAPHTQPPAPAAELADVLLDQTHSVVTITEAEHAEKYDPEAQ